MNYLSLTKLILCILLPPVLYVFSLQALEIYFADSMSRDIENIYTGDTRPLFEGDIRLKDAVNRNIDRYLERNRVIPWGVSVDVLVTAGSWTVIYPAEYDDDGALDMLNPTDVAAENFRLMNEGLLVDVTVNIRHNTVVSNCILAFFIMVSIGVLSMYYRAGSRKVRMEANEKRAQIERLIRLETEQAEKLNALNRERETLSHEVKRVRKEFEDDRIRASQNEEGMIEEIISLEKKLNENLELQLEMVAENDALKEQIKRYDKELKKTSRQKIKETEIIQKRFKVLYKRIQINEKAVDGFLNLSEDMRLKGEEILHQLNEDPFEVPVKRKISGKKVRDSIFEVMFAYNGRLYYRKTRESKVDVLSIGTKNSQTRDLAMLEKLTVKN